jgi:hypothetical protein
MTRGTESSEIVVTAKGAQFSHSASRHSFAVKQWEAGALPTPHLLDGTWWFDDETVEYFQRQIRSVIGQTVCLGTPSVFLKARHEGMQRVILVDRDPLVRDLLTRRGHPNVITADLQRVCPLASEADLIIADPPWYENEINAFLDASHAASNVGAKILMSIPPPEIRPTIEQERHRIFARAKRSGLMLLSIQSGGTRYVCPPFEHNVMRSTGENFLHDWRVGDLATFEVTRAKVEGEEPILDIGDWDDICLANTRLRVARRTTLVQGQPQLISMGWPEDIFPSCSRRHPRRMEVDVWTSGNRAFRCKDTNGLLEIALHLSAPTLEELRQKVRNLPPSFCDEQRQAAAQLLSVVSREEHEYEVVRRLYV